MGKRELQSDILYTTGTIPSNLESEGAGQSAMTWIRSTCKNNRSCRLCTKLVVK